MVGVCQPFLATPTQGWMSAHCHCPLLLPLPRRGCGSCKLLTSTTTQANTNTTMSSLPRFDSPAQLAGQWMDCKPNERGGTPLELFWMILTHQLDPEPCTAEAK